MLYIIISFCTFLASIMSLFSGFGLGTVLMPVVAIPGAWLLLGII